MKTIVKHTTEVTTGDYLKFEEDAEPSKVKSIKSHFCPILRVKQIRVDCANGIWGLLPINGSVETFIL